MSRSLIGVRVDPPHLFLVRSSEECYQKGWFLMTDGCKYCGYLNSHSSVCPSLVGDEAKRIWQKGYDDGREHKEKNPELADDSSYRLGWDRGREVAEHAENGHD